MKAKYFLTGLFLCILSVSFIYSAEPDDKEALAGLRKARAVFDISSGDSKKLIAYLNLIEKTSDTVRANGADPDFIITFRGSASFFISKEKTKLRETNKGDAKTIFEILDRLGGLREIKLEQCSVAAKGRNLNFNSFHKSVKLVGNSWISLIAYQNKGYALVALP